MTTKKTTPKAKIYGNNDESWVHCGRSKKLPKITITLNKIAFGSLFFFAGFALGGLLYYQESPTGSYPIEALCDSYFTPEEVEEPICAKHEFPICETHINKPLTF